MDISLLRLFLKTYCVNIVYRRENESNGSDGPRGELYIANTVLVAVDINCNSNGMYELESRLRMVEIPEEIRILRLSV